jgi:hypothetical protein
VVVLTIPALIALLVWPAARLLRVKRPFYGESFAAGGVTLVALLFYGLVMEPVEPLEIAIPMTVIGWPVYSRFLRSGAWRGLLLSALAAVVLFALLLLISVIKTGTA